MEINSWICIMHHGQIQLSGSMKEALFFPRQELPNLFTYSGGFRDCCVFRGTDAQLCKQGIYLCKHWSVIQFTSALCPEHRHIVFLLALNKLGGTHCPPAAQDISHSFQPS